MLSGAAPSDNDAKKRAEESAAESPLMNAMLRMASDSLDHIEEPTAEELAAIDAQDELDDVASLDVIAPKAPLNLPELGSALSLLSQLEEPELVSLESLDDAEPDAGLNEDLDDVEELLDDVDSLIDEYVDLELEDDDLEDEGYDLDDDDDGSYRDLYGEDDAIIPSFREGEFAEEEDGDTDYYNELR